MRVLYGLDRIPRSLSPDDPRLPGVTLGPAPLRLNSYPVPGAILAGAGNGHLARRAAATAWLQGQCGDYAAGPRRFIAEYMDFVADELGRRHAALAAALGRYDGVYAVEDWTWSALRPLPRAWVASDGEMVRMDVAFWDGRTLTAVLLGEAPAPAGLAVIRPGTRTLTDVLPAAFRDFWRGETLPRSPFRRPELLLG